MAARLLRQFAMPHQHWLWVSALCLSLLVPTRAQKAQPRELILPSPWFVTLWLPTATHTVPPLFTRSWPFCRLLASSILNAVGEIDK